MGAFANFGHMSSYFYHRKSMYSVNILGCACKGRAVARACVHACVCVCVFEGVGCHVFQSKSKSYSLFLQLVLMNPKYFHNT